MAATLTDSNNLTYLSFPIEKTETTPDGDLVVYGKATDGSVDSDEQIVDPEFSSKAIADWLASGANVRVQHNAQRDPAGVGVEANTGPGGETWVKSLVVEPVAKRLVEKGALRAYSVGIARPKIVRDAVARGGRIVDGEIVEISLVDRPANKNCGIQLVKSDKDGAPEWVGKVFGDEVLTKAEEVDSVSVDLPSNVSVSFSPADLAKLLEHRRIAEKRQMDPAVGGGVDREKIPAEDFAGRGRSFPIVTPGDVSDAASSIGRAGPSNYSTDKLKANIIAIARRKGDAFVAELPQKWRDEMAGKKSADEAAEKAKQPKKKPFPGAHPGFTSQHQPPHDDADLQDDEETKPQATKGAKTCGKCGTGYDADSKMRKCEKCGAKLPKANKGAKTEEVGSVDSKTIEPAAVKGDDVMCLGCGHELDDDDKFCSKCGKANPAFEGKASKPTPGEGVVGEGAADIKPVPEHREPDGKDVEEFEHDAGLPTVPDRDVEMKAAMRLKTLGVPHDQGALHDLLCPAYHPDDTAKAHPGAGLGGVDVTAWQAKALDAATGASLQEAVAATQLWQHATTLKGTDPEVLADLRDEVHKAFRDANPGPATFPKPTELSATSFRRPYLAAGHAAPSPGQQGPTTSRVPTDHMSASDFHRGHLDTGHAADSPSNKNTAVQPAPVPAGAPQRTYYRNTQRDAARSAMAAMHDHIAQTFPDLCPMSGPGVGGEPPVGARPVPVPGAAKAAAAAEDEQHMWAKKARKLEKQLAKARKAAGLEPATVTKTAAPASATIDPEVIKAAIVEATAPLAEKLAATEQTLREQREMLDALGDLPDPATAPFKGVAQNTYKTAASPAGALTVAETAERTQLMMMRELESQFRTSPDPAQREAAWNALVKMRGLPQ